MAKSTWAAGVFLAAIAIAAAWGGWRMFEQRSHSGCDACGRPLHSQTRVDAQAGEERRLYCCPACFFAQRRQTGAALQAITLTGHETGEPIPAADAHLVVGSRVNHCLREGHVLDEHKEPLHLEFDRCAPSILAFATRAAAARFMAEHGGQMQTFLDLEQRAEPGYELEEAQRKRP